MSIQISNLTCLEHFVHSCLIHTNRRTNENGLQTYILIYNYTILVYPSVMECSYRCRIIHKFNFHIWYLGMLWFFYSGSLGPTIPWWFMAIPSLFFFYIKLKLAWDWNGGRGGARAVITADNFNLKIH
jgi:hypothetical protein